MAANLDMRSLTPCAKRPPKQSVSALLAGLPSLKSKVARDR
jgi:hypothetical protein